MSNRGRPSKGTGKKYTRTLTSDPEIEFFLQKHRDITASDLFRAAVRAIMPKDEDEMRLRELEDKIREQKASLAIMEFEFSKLKNDLDRKKQLQVDTRIEADLGAWYMRTIWQKGIFLKIERIPLEKAIRSAMEKGRLQPNELIKKDGSWYLTDKATEFTVQYWTGLYDSDEKGRLFQRPPHLSITEKSLRDTYFLILKPGKFQEFERYVLTEDVPTGEIPLDFFKKYDPKIISDRLKEDLRKQMLPFYDGSYEHVDLEVAP